MSRRRSFLPQAAVVALLLAATAIWTGKAFPRIDPAERALVAATRAGAEAQCDCASASTHRAYLRCVSHAMKALAAGQLSKRGMHAAMRCAQRSSCGRAGKATCCMTDAQGHMQCAITTAAKCVAPPGSTTCVTSFASLCDAIDQGCRQAAHDINCCLPPSSSAGGAFVCEPQKPSECAAESGIDMGGDGSCVPDPCGAVGTTTTTVVGTTTTTTVASLCGNGILDPGEECDPPWSRTCPARGPGHINRECQDDCTCPANAVTTTTIVGTTSTTIPAETTTTTIAGTTSTTIPAETTTTTIAGTTTTSTIAGCNCCTGTGRLAFTTGLPPSGSNCGTVVDDTGANLLSLVCGGLYFGGAGVGVPPSVIPDGATSFTNLASCDAGTGAITFSATTDTDTGSNRNCTAAGITNPEYPGKLGCLFGPPLPIPNPNSPATSTCVVNRVTTSASGNGNCNDGSVALLNIPLGSDIYLTGPTDGVVPCPRCTGTPSTCTAGPNAGQPCTAVGTPSATSPTSHDCPPAANAFIGTLPIPFALSTGSQSKTSTDLPAQPFVFCGFCGQQFSPSFQGPPAKACTADSQCTTAPFTKCRQRTSGAFAQGPARTVSETGSPGGACLSDGAMHDTTLVSVFCIPPAFNATVDAAGDLPSPGAVALPGQSQFIP